MASVEYVPPRTPCISSWPCFIRTLLSTHWNSPPKKLPSKWLFYLIHQCPLSNKLVLPEQLSVVEKIRSEMSWTYNVISLNFVQFNGINGLTAWTKSAEFIFEGLVSCIRRHPPRRRKVHVRTWWAGQRPMNVDWRTNWLSSRSSLWDARFVGLTSKLLRIPKRCWDNVNSLPWWRVIVRTTPALMNYYVYMNLHSPNLGVTIYKNYAHGYCTYCKVQRRPPAHIFLNESSPTKTTLWTPCSWPPWPWFSREKSLKIFKVS